MIYVSRQTEVDAMQVRDLIDAAGVDWSGLPEWVQDAYADGQLVIGSEVVHLKTSEGIIEGGAGDYLSCAFDGGLQVHKQDQFEANFEAQE